jgi:NADPH:quinone reductase-like Zn-dependent oxidoreductase
MISATDSSTRRQHEAELHEIRVQGHLDDRWADWVEGLTFTHERDGTTTLTGPITDQAALHGVLNRLRDLNVAIVSVRRLSCDRERGTTMQAIVQDRYGWADVLQLREIERPVVGDDQVLLRVHAAGLHIGDVHLMTGRPYLMRIMGFGVRAPKQRVPGRAVAGTVVAVGDDVTRFEVGDEVFGVSKGAFAEYAAAREDKLAAKPSGLSFEEAAAVPISATTALQALRLGRIEAGQHVLIIGASGGVGTYAVQLAKAYGARVTGVTSAAKADLVRSLGADDVIDYATGDATDGSTRYDVIIDIAGNTPLRQLRRALEPTGSLVIVGGEGKGKVTGGLGRSLRAPLMSLFVRPRLTMLVSKEHHADLIPLTDLIDAGKVTPSIDATYPLDEAKDAMRRLEAGSVRGKISIIVSSLA